MSLKQNVMKNSLICGMALVALAVAAPVRAAEWEIGLGAELELFFGYVSYDGATSSGFDGGDAVGSGRVFIVPTLTSDNSLKFGANIEIEGHAGERNAGAALDEASLFLMGRFGEVRFGKSDTPGNHMQIEAPENYGPDVNFAGLSTVVLPSMLQFSNIHSTVRVGDDLLRGTLGSTYVSNAGEDTLLRLTYFTPRFAGFQLGVSYGPDGPNSASTRQDFFDIGANYIKSYNDIDLSVSAKWGVADSTTDPSASPDYWGAGLSLGYRGFALGGSYAESSNSSGGITDGEAFAVGASYQTGRYGFSIHYLSGQNTDNENAALGTKEQLDAFTLAANYALTSPTDRPVEPPRPGADFESSYGLQQGMGASIFGFVSLTDFTEDVGDGGLGTPGDDVDGIVIGAGIELTF